MVDAEIMHGDTGIHFFEQIENFLAVVLPLWIFSIYRICVQSHIHMELITDFLLTCIRKLVGTDKAHSAFQLHVGRSDLLSRTIVMNDQIMDAKSFRMGEDHRFNAAGQLGIHRSAKNPVNDLFCQREAGFQDQDGNKCTHDAIHRSILPYE